MKRIETHVDALLESYSTLAGGMEHIESYHLPSPRQVERALELARELIFPGYVNLTLIRATEIELRDHVRELVMDLEVTLRRQIYRGLHHKVQVERGSSDHDCPHCASVAEEISDKFLAGIQGIRRQLAQDVEAHYKGCPAASGTDEVILCYPGLYAISVYRIANLLSSLGAKLIPRMMSSLAHQRVGIDIHPRATIGNAFLIDHGTGVVIGETTIIGNHVRLYQGVTLGALSVKERAGQGVKRHPTIEDGVIIYAGATILGGDTVIGEGSVIGGSCWVTTSVEAGEVVTNQPRTLGG